jgi:hypothetical protein
MYTTGYSGAICNRHYSVMNDLVTKNSQITSLLHCLNLPVIDDEGKRRVNTLITKLRTNGYGEYITIEHVDSMITIFKQHYT